MDTTRNGDATADAATELWWYKQKPSGTPGSQPCAVTLNHTFWASLFLTVNKAHKTHLITLFVSD